MSNKAPMAMPTPIPAFAPVDSDESVFDAADPTVSLVGGGVPVLVCDEVVDAELKPIDVEVLEGGSAVLRTRGGSRVMIA